MTYFAQNQPEYNYLRHLQLVAATPSRQIGTKELAYNVAHINTKGKPDAWFFDSFLIYATQEPGSASFYSDVNLGTTACGRGDFFAVPVPNPSSAHDWRTALDLMLGRDGFVPRLEETISTLRTKIGLPAHKPNVVLAIPYPNITQTHFGAVRDGGPRLNFTVTGQNLMKACEQRLEACRWFVDEAIARWKKARFREVNLLGFYWVFETMHYSWDVDDHWVVKELYKHTKAREKALFWIPFYSTRNINIMSDSRELYFDCAFLQPNHMFYDHLDSVKPAADAARARGGGVEMEYYLEIDPTVDIGEKKHTRWRNYLNGGVEHGYMTQAACAYFNGFNELHKLPVHRNPKEREAYHDLFHFVKGDYEKKP